MPSPRCLRKEGLTEEPGFTRGASRGDALLAFVRVLDLALGDFFEGHRQVVLGARLHERRRVVVERALAELVVVVVDLPRAISSMAIVR